MTLRERNTVMSQISRAMELVNEARASVALDQPNEAQESLLALSLVLLGLESLAGCFTPQSLFGD